MDRETLINLITIVPLAIGLFIYYYRQHLKEKNATSKEPSKVNSDGELFIKKLNDLGYFKYVATETLQALKSEIIHAYENYGELATIESQELPACFRLFPADAEYIYEEGGFIETLKEVSNAFKSRGLKFEINEHFEKYEENSADQWVIVNQKKYIIYDGIYSSKMNWEMATSELTYLLNEQLEDQQSEERVYTISGGNDGMIIFLTKDQYEYIHDSNLREEFRPQIVNNTE